MPLKYVNAERLREELWDEQSRPSVQTIHKWKKNGVIPYRKIGRSVFFVPSEVQEKIDGRLKVKSKSANL